ncbi:hypothetical protein [Peribacillus simplex]|nr:hypothetical protein [Peribacillus simplex]
MIGAEGTRLLLRKARLRETPQAIALMRLGRQSAERDFKEKLIGTEGARLLLRKARLRETPQA